MEIEELYTVEAHEEGAEMQVKDEFGKLLDMYIKVAGEDSKLYKLSISNLRRALLKDGVDSEGERAKAIAKITLDWRGFKSKNKRLKFSHKAVTQLYKSAPYILDQVDLFVSKRANFTKGKAVS